ncbi:MAG TPA: type II toxin-antitoxin system RelE/ParE family toxin [Thermoanaerobaculia bacterium]|nr:type II toxin-antitoxin system RelE/ParE family toxin [Thermoanaerobaculia bacterium]
MQKAEQAAEFPQAGRVVPEVDLPHVREVFLGNYRIVYRIGDRELIVWMVFEGHRSWPGAPEELEEEKP